MEGGREIKKENRETEVGKDRETEISTQVHVQQRQRDWRKIECKCEKIVLLVVF